LSGYQLIDFGRGRKLESLHGYRIDRPSPAASGHQPRLPPQTWAQTDAFFCQETRKWRFRTAWPPDLSLDAGPFRLPFRPAPSGHIGCFPEQMPQWSWLADRLRHREQSQATDEPDVAESLTDPVPACLNLFAHTGGSSLAMAAAGAEVTHVDAAKPSVQAARRAAEESGLGTAPIRFLVEDAARFVTRELRRGRRYQAIVLDPPSYGHAPNGKAWRIQRDLWPLLDDCLELLAGPSRSLLVTGHGGRPDQFEIAAFLQSKAFGRKPDNPLQCESGRSELRDQQGRVLDAGFFVRISIDRCG